MATEVFTTEEIALLDGTEVELRPLPIAKLRKFMRVWSNHIAAVTKAIGEGAASESDEPYSEADLTEAQFDAYIKMCAFGLESQLKGEKSEKQFLAYLEDVLDEATIYKILHITGGLRPNGDPNLQGPPPATATVEDGTN